jgi:hypothetical protein
MTLLAVFVTGLVMWALGSFLENRRLARIDREYRERLKELERRSQSYASLNAAGKRR